MLDLIDGLDRLFEKIIPFLLPAMFIALGFIVHALLRLVGADSWPEAIVLTALLAALCPQWASYWAERGMDDDLYED